MVDTVSIQKTIGIISVITALFFILTNFFIGGIAILSSYFLFPFYMFFIVGVLSYLFSENIVLKMMQCLLVFFSGVFALYSSYWSRYPIILFLLSLLLMMGYKFYDKHTIIKIILTILILFITFVFCSSEPLIEDKLFTACNIFVFLLVTFLVSFIIFKKSEQVLLKDFKIKQIEIEEMERKLAMYKVVQPDFQECIDDLLRLSSEELGIIKELQSSLNGGHNGDTNRN